MTRKTRTQATVDKADSKAFMEKVSAGKALIYTPVKMAVIKWMKPLYVDMKSQCFEADGTTMVKSLSWAKLAEYFAEAGGGRINPRLMKQAYEEITKELVEADKKSVEQATIPAGQKPTADAAATIPLKTPAGHFNGK